MTEVEWISVASKAFTYCGHLLRIIKKQKEISKNLQEEITNLKTKIERQEKFIDDLTGKDGCYDTVC